MQRQRQLQQHQQHLWHGSHGNLARQIHLGNGFNTAAGRRSALVIIMLRHYGAAGFQQEIDQAVEHRSAFGRAHASNSHRIENQAQLPQACVPLRRRGQIPYVTPVMGLNGKSGISPGASS